MVWKLRSTGSKSFSASNRNNAHVVSKRTCWVTGDDCVAVHAISAQNELKILSNEFLTRQRAFFTPEGSTLSSSRPREAAGQPSNKKNEKVPVPDGTTLSQLEDIFHNIESEIRLLNKDSGQKYDPHNLAQSVAVKEESW